MLLPQYSCNDVTSTLSIPLNYMQGKINPQNVLRPLLRVTWCRLAYSSRFTTVTIVLFDNHILGTVVKILCCRPNVVVSHLKKCDPSCRKSYANWQNKHHVNTYLIGPRDIASG